MSKHLRTFLLSVLVVIIAASSALAATTEITFKWIGETGNYWGHASNWEASVSYDKVKDKIVALKDSIEYYPGNVVSSDTSAMKVHVIISKDAAITMTQAGSAVGSLVGITDITITGTASKTAKVTIDMGADSWFEKAPSITLANHFTSLRINGTHSPAFKITSADTTWQGISADLALYMPVSFSGSGTLNLNVDNANLTIGNTTLLGSSYANRTSITVDQTKTSKTSRLIFDVEGSNSGQTLDILLKNNARRIDTLKDFTLNVWSQDVKYAISMDSKKEFIKGGSAKLTLNKADVKHRKNIPVISTDKFSVIAGTLAFTGTGYAPLGRYATTDTVTFTVENGALDLGTRTISADTGAEVDFIVKSGGTVYFRNAAIDANDKYTGSELVLNSNVSADVRSGGVLHFYGSQAIEHLRGAGTIESEGTGSMLILEGTSDDIKSFTGTIKSLDIGIKAEWPIIPFLTKAAAGSSINNLYVFGNGGKLKLHADKLDGIEGLNETNIYLRSNIPGATSDTQLRAIKVGALEISGDIALGVVSVDGTKDANNVGTVTLVGKNPKLTVEKLVLHANADKDFGASSKGTSNVYVSVYAIDVEDTGAKKGIFAPKQIVNGTSVQTIRVGTEDSILVQNATLELKNGVELPAYNSLLLKTASIDVDNDTRVRGNFVVDGHSRIRVALKADNARTFETSKDIESGAIVVDGIFKVSGDRISVDIVNIEDPARFLGEMYGVVSYASRDLMGKEVTSIDVGLTGAYSDNKSIELGLDNNGLYAQLVKWLIRPRVYEWEFTAGDLDSEFGMANKQFEAVIGYGLSDDISPDITDQLRPIFTLYHNNVPATPSIKVGNARQNIKSGATGENLAFLMLSQDLSAHTLTLSGTSYKTSLDVRITLSWDMSASSLAKYKTARITPKVSVGGTLGSDYAHNGPIVSDDLVNLEGEKRPLMNPDREDVPEVSGDVYADVDATPTGSVVFKADEDAKFEFRVEGLTMTTTTSGLPRLVNGLYVWDNGYDTSSTYTITISGDAVTVKDFQLLVGGKAVNMASVDIEADGTGVKVSVPVSLLGGATGSIPETKDVELTAKAEDGRTVHITAPSVTVVPATYIAGTPAQATYSFTEGKIPTAEQTVTTGDLSGDDVQYLITGNAPAGITWNNAAGAVSYTLAQDTAPGNYDVTVYAYNGTQTYGYTFAIVVAEGFRVRPEEPYTGFIAGTNYVAYFTASNAPEGVIEWTTSTLPAWATATKSGDTFVVFGQLPAYDGSEYDEVDPNAFEITVTATVAGESQSATVTPTVVEDTDTTAEPAASAVTSTGDIHTADRNYSVTINYTADDYGQEISDFNLPYWLVATPVLGGDDGDEVRGYTLSFRTGADVANGATGVVRYTDLAGNIISWAVTFNDGTPPQVLAIAADPATLNIAAGTTSVVTMSATNAIGTVTYTTNQSWAVVNGNRITITAPSASATVTVTGTDAGRTENATAQTTITVTVIQLRVTASETSLSLQAGATATVTLSANKTGVTYTSNQSWAVVDGSTVTITAPSETAAVAITGTDSDGNTDTVDITVNVTPVEVRVTAVTMFSDTNIDSADVIADRDVTSWAVYVNGSTVDWAAITATGARTARVTLKVPSNLAEGKYAITVTATDANGTSAPLSLGSFTVAIPIPDDNPGGSSGGCDAGFGAMALAFAAPLFLRRRRS